MAPTRFRFSIIAMMSLGVAPILLKALAILATVVFSPLIFCMLATGSTARFYLYRDISVRDDDWINGDIYAAYYRAGALVDYDFI